MIDTPAYCSQRGVELHLAVRSLRVFVGQWLDERDRLDLLHRRHRLRGWQRRHLLCG